MSTYMMMPKDYIRELMKQGHREKASCFMEYMFDLDEKRSNSIGFYASAWNKSKSTTHSWVQEFKEKVAEHFDFWTVQNEVMYRTIAERLPNDLKKKPNARSPKNTSVKSISPNALPNDCRTTVELSVNTKENKRVQSKFVAPTLRDLEAYSQEQNLVVDIEKFFKYYTATDWKDNKGKSVKSWKLKLITWSGKSLDSKSSPKQIALEDMPMEERIIVAERQRQEKIRAWEVANGF